MNQYQAQFEEKNIFEETFEPATHATAGQRFVNYLVDRIFIVLITWGIFIVVARMDLSLGDSFIRTITSNYLMTHVIITSLYTLVEGLSKGYSLGKLITGTRAVFYADYSPITFREALLRSLCRLIPFNTISGLNGNPWHDQITKTCVIQVR